MAKLQDLIQQAKPPTYVIGTTWPHQKPIDTDSSFEVIGSAYDCVWEGSPWVKQAHRRRLQAVDADRQAAATMQAFGECKASTTNDGDVDMGG